MATGGPNGLPTTSTTSSSGSNTNLTFYPGYCFPASPTYFTWVKLTAFDVHHTLSSRRGFEGQNLYFYLNHPVQFVYLVGVVVAYEASYEKRWVLTIDDSSGATIEVTCPKPDKDDVVVAGERIAREPGRGLDAAYIVQQKLRGDVVATADVGSVLQVKGTVRHFRNVRQIHLERVAVVPDTTEEMRFWHRRTHFKLEVLSVPWTVSLEEQTRLRKAAERCGEEDRARIRRSKEREAAKEAREKRHAKKIAQRYEAEQVKRKDAAESAKQGAQLLMVNGSREHGIDGPRKKIVGHST